MIVLLSARRSLVSYLPVTWVRGRPLESDYKVPHVHIGNKMELFPYVKF